MEIRKYWLIICAVCFISFLMVGCSLSSPSEPDTDTPVSLTGAPAVQDSPQEDGTTPAISQTGSCNGSELLCLPAMTPELVKKAGGRVLGGRFSNGEFHSSSRGGIAFKIRINTARPLRIEFDIKNNIPNWRRGENSGGKVSLVTLQQSGGHYYYSLQRMYRSYRGGGIFRAIIADRPNALERGAGFLVTTSGLAGHYSMSRWGNEPHSFKITIQGNSTQLNIDSYRSGSSSAPYGIRGTRTVTLILGNRELERLGMGQGAKTTFTNLRVTN